MSKKTRRYLLWALALLLIILLGGASVWQIGIRTLKTRIERTLGPLGEIGSIDVGLSRIEIRDLRIRARPDSGWPSEDELRAARIEIVPRWNTLTSPRIVIAQLLVEGAYLSLLRSRDGKLHLLPGLLETDSATSANGTSTEKGRAVTIDRITLHGGTIDFHDTSLRAKPVALRLEQIEATVGTLRVPELTGSTSIRIDGTLRGKRHDGRLHLDGAMELATLESGLSTQLRGVDMTALQPYLIQTAQAGVRRGTLDLDIKSAVTAGKLRAPGTLTLSGLELDSGGGLPGLSRNAALALLKDGKGRIGVKFILEGDLKDPRFSLNEHLATRIASGLANSTGVSVESLARNVGSLGSAATRTIGDSAAKLLDRTGK